MRCPTKVKSERSCFQKKKENRLILQKCIDTVNEKFPWDYTRSTKFEHFLRKINNRPQHSMWFRSEVKNTLVQNAEKKFLSFLAAAYEMLDLCSSLYFWVSFLTYTTCSSTLRQQNAWNSTIERGRKGETQTYWLPCCLCLKSGQG